MKIEKDSNPKDFLNQLLELGDRATQILLADKEDALEVLLSIDADVTRLEKLRKDYNEQTAIINNQNETN